MTKSTHFTFSSTDGYSIEIKERKKKKKKILKKQWQQDTEMAD